MNTHTHLLTTSMYYSYTYGSYAPLPPTKPPPKHTTHTHTHIHNHVPNKWPLSTASPGPPTYSIQPTSTYTPYTHVAL